MVFTKSTHIVESGPPCEIQSTYGLVGVAIRVNMSVSGLISRRFWGVSKNIKNIVQLNITTKL